MTLREGVPATLQGLPTDTVAVDHVGFSSRIATMILWRKAYVGGGIRQRRESQAL